MRNPLGFFRELLKQPLAVLLWVFYLMLIHLAALFFWNETPAKLIFATFMASAMLMMGLYSCFGFQKILGAGHVLWVPLLLYILLRLPFVQGGFGIYLVILAVSITISLVLDVVDVWKFFRESGEPGSKQA